MALNLYRADLCDIEKIGAVTHFTIHLRSSPHNKVTVHVQAAMIAQTRQEAATGARKPG